MTFWNRRHYLFYHTLAVLPKTLLQPYASLSPGDRPDSRFMGYAGQSISVLTSVVPIVILVVALSDATHLVVSARESWRNGRAINEAVVHTFTSLLAPASLRP